MIQSGSHNRRQSRPGALAGIGCTMSRVRRGAGLCFGSGFRGTEDRFLIASVLAGCLVVLILLSKPRGANTSRCQREQIMTYEIAIIVGSPSP